MLLAWEVGCSQIHTCGLLEVHPHPHSMSTIPQKQSSLVKLVTLGPYSREDTSRNEWYPDSPHPLQKG